MGPYGYAFSSETAKPSETADDFLCEGGADIGAVRWWGTYYEPAPAVHFYSNSAKWNDPTIPNIPAGIIGGFTVRIYSNIAAGTDPGINWARPGIVEHQEYFTFNDVGEMLYGTITRTGTSAVQQNVWEYYIEFEDPFEQIEGTTYWLSIQADHDDNSIQWGWQETDRDLYGWNAHAVQSGYSSVYDWALITNKEMAFELIPVPEPVSIFGIALTLLGLYLRKRGK